MGRHAEEEHLHKRAIKILEENYGPEHEQVATAGLCHVEFRCKGSCSEQSRLTVHRTEEI